jgi:hypothetical protein
LELAPGRIDDFQMDSALRCRPGNTPSCISLISPDLLEARKRLPDACKDQPPTIAVGRVDHNSEEEAASMCREQPSTVLGPVY